MMIKIQIAFVDFSRWTQKRTDHSLSHNPQHRDAMFCQTDVMHRAPIFSHRQMSFNNADNAELCQINFAISQLTRVCIDGVCDDFPSRAHL